MEKEWEGQLDVIIDNFEDWAEVKQFIQQKLDEVREEAIYECIEEIDSLIPSYDRTDMSFLDDEGKGELKAYRDIIDVLSGLK